MKCLICDADHDPRISKSAMCIKCKIQLAEDFNSETNSETKQTS